MIAVLGHASFTGARLATPPHRWSTIPGTLPTATDVLLAPRVVASHPGQSAYRPILFQRLGRVIPKGDHLKYYHRSLRTLSILRFDIIDMDGTTESDGEWIGTLGVSHGLQVPVFAA